MRRRQMLKLSALGAGALAMPAGFAAVPRKQVLDAHIHLFDPTRPGGIPWPEKSDTTLYQPALPVRHINIARPFNVVGAIAIEASPLHADTEWLFGVAASTPWIVGLIANLDPFAPDFRSEFDRYHYNPLFLGLRYGNLWGRDLAADLGKPGFLDSLKALAEAELVFETANPNPRLIRAVLDVAERVPGLRIVVDHLPNAQVPADTKAQKAWEQDLHHLAACPNLWVKFSEIPVQRDGKLVTDLAFYQARLDALWSLFGPDRVLFGSDWPNSDHIASYADTFALVRAYIDTKPPESARKFFFLNSLAVYRWQPRMFVQHSA